MIRAHARNCIVWSLLVPMVYVAAPAAACDQRVFGKLDPCVLNEIRVQAPEQRAARMASYGLTENDWLPQFKQAVERYIRMAPHARKLNPEMITQVTYGAILAELVRSSDAAVALEKIVDAPGLSESVVYSALLALDALRPPDDWMLSRMNHADARIARLAILTAGTHDDIVVQDQINKLRAARGSDSSISAAIQFIDLYRHDVARYAGLTQPSEMAAFIESRLVRAFNPVKGVMQTWDPHAAGHPLSRWALKQWRVLAESHPQEVVAHIARTEYGDSEALTIGYRTFLTQIAGLETNPQ